MDKEARRSIGHRVERGTECPRDAEVARVDHPDGVVRGDVGIDPRIEAVARVECLSDIGLAPFVDPPTRTLVGRGHEEELQGASGNTTVPMSRPSITAPPTPRARWAARIAERTGGCFATVLTEASTSADSRSSEGGAPSIRAPRPFQSST